MKRILDWFILFWQVLKKGQVLKLIAQTKMPKHFRLMRYLIKWVWRKTTHYAAIPHHCAQLPRGNYSPANRPLAAQCVWDWAGTYLSLQLVTCVFQIHFNKIINAILVSMDTHLLIWNIIWKEMKLCAFCYFNTQSGSSGYSLVLLLLAFTCNLSTGYLANTMI